MSDSTSANNRPNSRKVAGTIPIPNDRKRLATNAAWFLIVLAYFPGSLLVQEAVAAYDLGSFLGWPVLHFWIIFVGPTLVFFVYLYDAYHRIGLDVQFDETIERAERKGSD